MLRATLCYMQSVTHREMRNQSAELLRRVEGGESIIITNHGRAVAVVSPLGGRTIDDLIEQGSVRRAAKAISALRSIRRRSASVSSSSIIDDARGRW